MSASNNNTVPANGWVEVKGFESDTETERFFLVPPEQSDVTENKIPTSSPLAKVLVGKQVGETVTFEPPGGKVELTIVDCGEAED